MTPGPTTCAEAANIQKETATCCDAAFRNCNKDVKVNEKCFRKGRLCSILQCTEEDDDKENKEDLSVGAIVGISVGSFVFVCLLVYVIRHKIKTGSWPFMKKESVPDIKIEMKGLIF